MQYSVNCLLIVVIASRLGLETESEQDLFVLRNVVMSPFQSAGNFVKELADKFQEVLEEKTKVWVPRSLGKAKTYTTSLDCH